VGSVTLLNLSLTCKMFIHRNSSYILVLAKKQ
jgi:hypothetical protein